VLLNSNTKYTINKDKITIIWCYSELFLFPDTGPCSPRLPHRKRKQKKVCWERRWKDRKPPGNVGKCK